MKTALLLSYICIASISAAIITPALPQIEASYQLAHGSLQWVISIFLCAYVIGQLVYGPLANRYGRLKALRTGLVINLMGIVISLLSAKTLNFSLLLLGRFITGLGASAGLSCTFILINELLDAQAAKRAMSFAIVSFTVGTGIAVTLGGILTQHFHWQDCFIVLFIHGLLMLAATYSFPETLKVPQPLAIKSIARNYAHTLRSGTFISYSTLVAFAAVVSYCYAATAPLYAQSTLHLSPANYGYWNLLNMLGMIASGLTSHALIARFGESNIIKYALGCFLICLGSLYLLIQSTHPSAIWFFITTSCMYYLSSLVFPAASYFATNTIADRASASSMMSFINMASATGSVIILGYLPFSALTALTAILTAYYLWIVFAYSFNQVQLVILRTD